jgi:hypothetical protein
MSCRLVFVALLFLPTATMAQTSPGEKTESGMANAQLIAARKAASAVTARQCLADLSSWEAKDSADEKTKVKQPNWWYQKLSTEKLARLAQETVVCFSALRLAHQRDDALMMPSYGRMFDRELLDRAEAVLVERHLMHEYLLKSSK